MTSTKSTPKPRRLEFSPLFVTNLEAIFDYIALQERSPMNAELVHGRIMATVDRIFQFPQSGRALGGSLRIAFVPKAACAVVYKVTTTRIILARIRMGRMKNIK